MYGDDDEEEYIKEEAREASVPAAQRVKDVEENFYANLSCARFRYVPARPGLKSWTFFAVYAFIWLVLAVVYVYTSVSYKNVWIIIFGLVFLAGMALGAVFVIRGVVFYYYDLYVCRVGDGVVNVLFSHWNKDVTVYFSHNKILRAHKGAVEERREYAYQYVGTHLLFNKFKADVKYVPNAEETIAALSNDGGTARLKVKDGLPAGITYAPPPSFRSEFGAIKYLKLVEYEAAEIPPVPGYLARECARRGWILPERAAVSGDIGKDAERPAAREEKKEAEKAARAEKRKAAKIAREKFRRSDEDVAYGDDDDED